MPTESQIDNYCKVNGYARTGVYATQEDTEAMAASMAEAEATPIIMVADKCLYDSAVAHAKNEIHRLSTEKYGLPGLPPLDGEPDLYGVIVTGEFIKLARAHATGDGE